MILTRLLSLLICIFVSAAATAQTPTPPAEPKRESARAALESITGSQWVELLILVILGLVFWQAVKYLARMTVGKILRQRYQYLTEKQIGKLFSPVGLFVFIIIFHLGLPFLNLAPDALKLVERIMFILTALAITWLVSRVVGVVALRLNQKARESNIKTDDLLVPFATTIIRIVIIIVAAIWVAGNFGFDVTSVIAGLGIGGIAIALASQETLSNFFGSLVLLIERPFSADDRVEIAGVKGTIQEVGLRSTKILNSENSVITMPNASIAKANIINQGVKTSPRWSIKLSIPYKNGAAKVENFCDGIEEIIRVSETLESEKFKIHLFDALPAALELRVEITFKVDDYDFEVSARHKFIMDLLRLTDKLDIQLEVPN